MNLTAIDQFSTAAVNRASTTSLSGALVKDIESSNIDESASSAEGSQIDEPTEVIVSYEEIEHTKDILQQRKSMSEQASYLSALHLLDTQMDSELGRPPVYGSEAAGALDGDRTHRISASAPVTDDSRSTTHPPKPVVPPLNGQMLAARDAISRINGAPSFVGASSGRLSVNSDCSEVAFLDPESQRALGRTYQFIALILLGRISARGSRLDEKFFNALHSAASARSNHSLLHRMKSGDSSDASFNMKYHQNVLFTVRDYLHSVARGSSLQYFITDSKLVDSASFRLIKLLSEHFFDTCLPIHLDSAERLAEGAFGSVYKVNCPISCDRCYKWGAHQRSKKLSNESQAADRSNLCQLYAVKRVNRERSVYDVAIINDIFTEITCLEMLSNVRGVCRLYNFGVYSGEYWLVMELCDINLLQWREQTDKSLRNFIHGSDIPAGTPSYTTSILSFMSVALALFEDACIILKNVHQLGIVHFDIKCSNFLIKGNPGVVLDWWRRRNALLQKGKDEAMANKNFWISSGILQLTDFGESVIFPTNDFESAKTSVSTGGSGSPLKRQSSIVDRKYVELNRARGTLCIQSPEMLVISNHPKESTLRELNSANAAATDRSHKLRMSSFPPPSYSSDIWSLGCVLVELVTGTPLFSDRPWPELYCLLCMDNHTTTVSEVVDKCLNTVVAGDISYPVTFLVDLKALAMSMLQQDPMTRASIGDTVARLSDIIRVHFAKSTEEELDFVATKVEHCKNGSLLQKSDARANVLESLRTDTLVNDILKLTENTMCISPKIYLSFSSHDGPFGYEMAHKVFETYNSDQSMFMHQNSSDTLTDMIDQIIYNDRTMSIESLPQSLVYRSLNHLQKRNKLTEVVLLVGNAEPESETSNGSLETQASGCFPWSHRRRNDAVSKKDGSVPEDIMDDKSGMIKTVMVHFSTEDLDSFTDRFRVALVEAEKALQLGDTVLITVRSTKTPLQLLSRTSSGELQLLTLPLVTVPPKPTKSRGHSSSALKPSKVAVEAEGSADKTGHVAQRHGYDPSSMAREKDSNIYAEYSTPSSSARDLTARAQEMSTFWKPIVCASTALACALVDASGGRMRRCGEGVATEDSHCSYRSSFSMSSSGLPSSCPPISLTTAPSPVECLAYIDAVDKAAPWVLKQCPRDFLVTLLEYSLTI
jgi:serine/threonine protein kinase